MFRPSQNEPIEKPTVIGFCKKLRFKCLISVVFVCPNKNDIAHFQFVTVFRFFALSFLIYPEK